MKIELNSDQLQISDVASQFLAQELPLRRLRELADDQSASLAIDQGVWRTCAEMGWFALGVPESRGGVGFGPVEEYALFRELGRHLAPGPYTSTVTAGWLFVSNKDDANAARVFDGSLRVGLVVEDLVIDAEPGGLALRFGPDGCSIHPVEDLDPIASVDPSVRLARANLGSAIATSTDPMILARARVLVAAQEVGVALAVRDLSVEYAKERHQFGKPIGTFQAVKHRCSDMATRVHAAHAQTLFAAMHVARRSPESTFHAAAAKLVASNAAMSNTADNVQNHGAIGFTVEHDAGLYARRAHMYEYALGGHAIAAPDVLTPSRHQFEGLADEPADWFSAG